MPVNLKLCVGGSGPRGKHSHSGCVDSSVRINGERISSYHTTGFKTDSISVEEHRSVTKPHKHSWQYSLRESFSRSVNRFGFKRTSNSKRICNVEDKKNKFEFNSLGDDNSQGAHSAPILIPPTSSNVNEFQHLNTSLKAEKSANLKSKPFKCTRFSGSNSPLIKHTTNNVNKFVTNQTTSLSLSDNKTIHQSSSNNNNNNDASSMKSNYKFVKSTKFATDHNIDPSNYHHQNNQQPQHYSDHQPRGCTKQKLNNNTSKNSKYLMQNNVCLSDQNLDKKSRIPESSEKNNLNISNPNLLNQSLDLNTNQIENENVHKQIESDYSNQSKDTINEKCDSICLQPVCSTSNLLPLDQMRKNQLSNIPRLSFPLIRSSRSRRPRLLSMNLESTTVTDQYSPIDLNRPLCILLASEQRLLLHELQSIKLTLLRLKRLLTENSPNHELSLVTLINLKDSTRNSLLNELNCNESGTHFFPTISEENEHILSESNRNSKTNCIKSTGLEELIENLTQLSPTDCDNNPKMDLKNNAN